MIMRIWVNLMQKPTLVFSLVMPTKKAFIIYNRRTRIIIETIHVTFDELTAMAFEQFSSGPRLQSMTPTTSSSGLVSNPVSQQPCIPPIRDDWDRLFQPMFNEYFNHPLNADSLVQEAAAPRAVILADSPVSTSIDQDASSSSIPSTQELEHSPIISQGFEESPKTPLFHDDCHTPSVAETQDATIPFIAQDTRSYTLKFTIIKLEFTYILQVKKIDKLQLLKPSRPSPCGLHLFSSNTIYIPLI
ncbi:hypothetical protein Tco_0462915 [Tanacetum coccineum]